jgi:FHS family L-fucose permease-like MFS transporter
LIGFLCGRILGAVLLRKIAPARILFSFALVAALGGAAVVMGTGELPIYSVVLLGACNSIMFPTIFALSLSGLGENTKVGSSVLVMSIVGGALLPPVMGWLSDRTNIQYAFSVPVIAYLVVLVFAVVSDRTERRLVTLDAPAAAASARRR